MNTLREVVAEQIRQTGPMPIDHFMSLCLLHPNHGYYNRDHPIGVKGSFVTAPEISQMFGELLGLCLAQCWVDQERPDCFTILELGPGRGTLMADMLRASAGTGGFNDPTNLLLLEQSKTLKREQAIRLSQHSPDWISSIEEVPNVPLFCVANEFIDALPIRQLTMKGNHLVERLVGLRQGNLVFGFSPAQNVKEHCDKLVDIADGVVIELRPQAEQIVKGLSDHIGRYGGAMLLFDYGSDKLSGNTLQALEAGTHANPLANPGYADLTSHVDFGALRTAVRSSVCSPLIPQGIFLERLGITERARILAKNMVGNQLELHVSAHRRLTHPDEMGSLFKTMAIFPKDRKPPPGYYE